MANEIDDLYLVQNGVDDVVDQDHNTLVEATNFVYNTLGGLYNVGNGIDGNIMLGSITATTATAPTAQSNGAGRLTGTFYYKYSAYNLSGETAVSSAATGLVLTAQQAKVTIPGVGNNNNITGYYVYRSIDDVTYYRVGFIALDTPSDGAIFYDNFDISSGTAPQVSNTSGATATADGIFKCRSFRLQSGETLTITDGTKTGLVVLSQGDITISSGSIINGTGKFAYGIQKPAFRTYDDQNQIHTTTSDGVYSTSTNSSTPNGGVKCVSSDSAGYLKLYLGLQGNGASATTPSKPGAALIFISLTNIEVQGTISANGETPSGKAGAAGGLFFAAAPYINRVSATINLNGGDGDVTALANSRCWGGGGGVAVFAADYLVGSATVNINGGSPATVGLTDDEYGGGGFGGKGGGISSGSAAGVAQDISLSDFIPGAF